MTVLTVLLFDVDGQYVMSSKDSESYKWKKH